MAEEIAVENGRTSNSERLVTLTFHRVILLPVVHDSPTSTYIANFIEMEETFCGWTDIHTYVHTDGRLRPASLGRLGRRVDLMT